MVAKRKPSPAVKKLSSNDRAPAKKKAAKKSVAVVSKSVQKTVPAGRLTDKKAPKQSAKESKKLVKEKAKQAVQKSKPGTKKPAPKKSIAAKIPAKSKPAPKKVAIVKAPGKNKPVPKKAAAIKPAPKKAAPKKAAPKTVAAKKPAVKASAQKKIAPKASASKKAVVAKKTLPLKPATKKSSVTKITTPKKAPTLAKVKVKAKPKLAKKSTGNVGSDSTASFTPYALKRHEDYMNEPQRAHFKSILLNWRNQLMEEVDRTVSHMKDEAANYPDPSDRASQEEEFSLELRTRDRERKLIRKIEKTIDMIDQDDYGYCDTCGVEIGIRRLEARPTANQCIDCKTLDELKERQLHG